MAINPFGLPPLPAPAQTGSSPVAPSLQQTPALPPAAPGLLAAAEAPQGETVTAKFVAEKPALAPADTAALDGMSPERTIAELQLLLQQNLSSVTSKDKKADAVVVGVVKEAAKNFVADIANAAKRWLSKPENLYAAGMFAVKLAQTVATAVATGGASLAVDAPLLAASAMNLASSFIKESGINPAELIGTAVRRTLMSAGMDPVAATHWGSLMGSALVGVAQVATFIATSGAVPLDLNTLADVVRDGTQVLGLTPAQADFVSSLAKGAAMVGSAFLNGGSELLNSGSLAKLTESANDIFKMLSSLTSGQVPDMIRLMSMATDFLAAAGGVMDALAKDTGIPDLGNKILAFAMDELSNLGPWAQMVLDGLDQLDVIRGRQMA